MISTSNNESPITVAQDTVIKANARIEAFEEAKRVIKNSTFPDKDSYIIMYDSLIKNLKELKKPAEAVVEKYTAMETISERDLIKRSQDFYESVLPEDGSFDKLKDFNNSIPHDNSDITEMISNINSSVIHNHNESANTGSKKVSFADENGGELSTTYEIPKSEKESEARKSIKISKADRKESREEAIAEKYNRLMYQEPKIAAYDRNINSSYNQFEKAQKSYIYNKDNQIIPDILDLQAKAVEKTYQNYKYYRDNPPAGIDRAYLNSRLNEKYTRSIYNQPSDDRPIIKNNGNEATSSNNHTRRSTSFH